jgi:hypothetical protein
MSTMKGPRPDHADIFGADEATAIAAGSGESPGHFAYTESKRILRKMTLHSSPVHSPYPGPNKRLKVCAVCRANFRFLAPLLVPRRAVRRTARSVFRFLSPCVGHRHSLLV